jgi:ATP-dependent DNA helicase RecG
VQWIEFSDNKVSDEYTNQVWMHGPLVRVCRELFEKLDSINKVRARFREGSVTRDDQPMYPRRALREGVVNAMVHRDYSSYSGGVKVSVYPNRVEIWNSGRLPDGLKTSDLKKDHPSILINPDITQAFYVAGLMEAIGRGTQKIVVDCKLLGAPTPTWKDAPTGVTLTIFSAGTISEEKTPTELNSRQKALLSSLSEGDVITHGHYREKYQVSDRQARRDLMDLVDEGELRREGNGPKTIYRRVIPSNRP